MRREALSKLPDVNKTLESRNGVISKRQLIRRGRELARHNGKGKHPEKIPEMPGQILMTDSRIPITVEDGIATGTAGAEEHEDMADVITVLEGTLVVVIGIILDPKILIDAEGDAIATETRGTRLLVEEEHILYAGDKLTIEPKKGHMHGSLTGKSTAIATFIKQRPL